MSEQFKVGEIVEVIDRSGLNLPRWVFEVGRVLLKDSNEYVFPADGLHSGLLAGKLRLAAPESLGAEKIRLLSRISEIDKQIEAEAQGDGLPRLRAIVDETGYFTDGRGLYWLGKGDIARTGSNSNVWTIPVIGFTFSHSLSQYGCGMSTECLYLMGNLEGWQSITMERFLRAKSDYESIVEKVKEAMEP